MIARAMPLLLSLLFLSACFGEAPDLDHRLRTALTSPATVGDWMIQGRNDFMVFDLRGEADFKMGHLPGAVRLEPARLAEPDTLRAFPDYKKLVFYNRSGEIPAEELRPLLAQGLTVLVVRGGYQGWERDVLSDPGVAMGEEDAKRVAVSRYFRGEAVAGAPQPLKDIPAGKYIRPAELSPVEEEDVPEEEGC